MPTGPDFFWQLWPPRKYDVRRQLPNFETLARAREYRHKHVAQLRKGDTDDRELARKLEACGPGHRCLSRACMVCTRRWRLWLVGEMLRLFHGQELLFSTLVFPDLRLKKGGLDRLEVRSLLERVKRQLDRSGMPNLVAIGGFDLSLDVDRGSKLAMWWQPHLHMITSGCSKEELGAALRPHYAKTVVVPRPLRIDPVRNPVQQMSYTAKSLYQRRITGTEEKYPLANDEQREVLRFVDQYGFGELVIMKGIRRFGSEFRLLAGR